MGERSQPVDVLSERLVTATVTTHDPSKYTLHNSEDGTVWQMGDDGRWERAAPDNAGRSPIDDHEGEPHEFRTACQRCGQSGYLNVALITANETVRIVRNARLSESTGSEEGGPTRVE